MCYSGHWEVRTLQRTKYKTRHSSDNQTLREKECAVEVEEGEGWREKDANHTRHHCERLLRWTVSRGLSLATRRTVYVASVHPCSTRRDAALLCYTFAKSSLRSTAPLSGAGSSGCCEGIHQRGRGQKRPLPHPRARVAREQTEAEGSEAEAFDRVFACVEADPADDRVGTLSKF